METNYKSALSKTDAVVNWGNESFPCYYDVVLDRCYYLANKEYLLIIDSDKIEEIKKSYKKKLGKIATTLGIIALGGAAITYATLLYSQSRKNKKKVKVEGKYKNLIA